MKLKSLALIGAALFFGCSKQDEEALLPQLTAEAQYIKSGIACGLCAGTCMDTLLITPDKLYYKKIIWGEEEPKSEIIEQSFTRKGWENLLGLIDLQEFESLDLESCSRCLDGCDNWLEVNSAGIHNSISFPWNAYPAEVDSLTKALNSIREQVNTQ